MSAVPTFSQIASVLAANGYEPVPITRGTKECHEKDWTDGGFADRAAQYKQKYTGILTRDTPAIDIDVSDPEVSKQIYMMVLDELGLHEAPPPARVGMAPRMLLLFRTEEPFAKIATSEYALPTDPTIGGKVKHSKVEILAAGQQFVAFAVHPVTCEPYRWNGEGDPLTVPRGRLPVLNEADANRIKLLAEELLARHGEPARTTPNSGTQEKTEQLSAQQIEDLRSALMSMPADDRDLWQRMGHALKCLGNVGRDLWLAWSARCSDKFRPEEDAKTWDSFKLRRTTYKAIFKAAQDRGWVNPRATGGMQPKLPIEQFHAFMPRHQYIHEPTGGLWPGASVNARVEWIGDSKPSHILDATRAVDQMSWMPGQPQIVADVAAVEAGIVQMKGVRIFNTYRAPKPVQGNPKDVAPYLLHAVTLYPEDVDHILDWFGHRVQRPEEKINHGLVLGGAFGIGKDTLLAPVLEGVGKWNAAEVSPVVLLGSSFNEFYKAVVLRISEARDLGDINLRAFYDHTKQLLAAPPDTLRVNEKHIPAYYVPNVMGVIITSNYRETGIYLPRDDRRHYVAWSELPERDAESADRCAKLWTWYRNGGMANVISYLRTRDISRFDPKAPPFKTAAFFAIAQANVSLDESELINVIEGLATPRPGRDVEMADWPKAITLRQLADKAASLGMTDLANDMVNRKYSRNISGRVGAAGYTFASNPSRLDGQWRLKGRLIAVYARRDQSLASQIQAAKDLLDELAQR